MFARRQNLIVLPPKENVPYENLSKIKFDEIKTHSFIEKECKLLQYVRNRSLVDIEKTKMDFSIYESDIVERHIRIPKLQQLYQRKLEYLEAFQRGKDIWKSRVWESKKEDKPYRQSPTPLL